LLLDEPLSNLDARFVSRPVRKSAGFSKQTGITTIFVTHDQEEAMSISDNIVVMKLGVEQQLGLPQEVYNDPANKFVANFLGTPPINFYNGKIKDNKSMSAKRWCVRSVKRNSRIKMSPSASALKALSTIDPKGSLSLYVDRIMTMGRDIMLVATNRQRSTAGEVRDRCLRPKSKWATSK
jgi:multiple sugar transport system ATP-binding protein